MFFVISGNPDLIVRVVLQDFVALHFKGPKIHFPEIGLPEEGDRPEQKR